MDNVSTTSSLRIDTMSRSGVDFAIGLAADEGWNPGLHDAAAFHAADPDGFLIGTIDDRPIGCISAVSYAGRFGFIGLYIVVPACRALGYGLRLWQAGMRRLAGHTIGLDGVKAQQDNYRRSGFRLAYSNVRFECTARPAAAVLPEIVDAATVPYADLSTYDRALFPAGRDAFLRGWIVQPDSAALAYVVHGKVRGYGVIRKARVGRKIGPLFADDHAIAEHLFLALCSRGDGREPVYLDVPEVNAAGMRLAQKLRMQSVFGTARMYAGDFPAIDLDRIFGVTTFELG